MKRVAPVLALALAACFGGGPAPSAPSDATIVFAIPDAGDCAPSPYLGDVAFAGSAGVIVLPPVENLCNNNGGGTPNQSPTSFVTFSLAGGDPGTQIGDLPVSEARVGWAGDQPIVVFAPSASNAELQLGSGSAASLGVPSPGGTQDPATVVNDGSAVWVAVWSGPNNINMSGGPTLPDFDDPGFPNGVSAFGGTTNSGSNGGYDFVKLGLDGSVELAFATSEQWFCNAMPDCLAQSSTSVFGMARGDGSNTVATIVAFPKATGATDADFTVVETIGQSAVGGSPVGPTGIAADDGHLAWVLSPDVETGQTGCDVFATDLAGGSAVQLLETAKFSCAGAAVDASAVYVAITENHGGGEDSSALEGLGLARIGFDGTFASIATGIFGSTAGARRVFVVGDLLYAVDPHTLAALPVDVFDGKHDFTP